MKPYFIPPKCEIKMEIASRNGVLFQLHGAGQFVTLHVWNDGPWQPVSSVGNHLDGWKLLDHTMESICEDQSMTASNG